MFTTHEIVGLLDQQFQPSRSGLQPETPDLGTPPTAVSDRDAGRSDREFDADRQFEADVSQSARDPFLRRQEQRTPALSNESR